MSNILENQDIKDIILEEGEIVYVKDEKGCIYGAKIGDGKTKIEDLITYEFYNAKKYEKLLEHLLTLHVETIRLGKLSKISSALSIFSIIFGTIGLILAILCLVY